MPAQFEAVEELGVGEERHQHPLADGVLQVGGPLEDLRGRAVQHWDSPTSYRDVRRR
jgi:hypothetical protein